MDKELEKSPVAEPEKDPANTPANDPEDPQDKEKKKTSIGDIINSIIALITSRLFVAGLLIFLGIRVALNPTSAPAKIAWGLGLAILICTAGIFISFFTTKSFNRANLVPIIETIFFTVLGACMIIFAKAFGVVLQEVICVAVIVNCTANILCLNGLNDIVLVIRSYREKKRSEKLV